MSGRRPTVAKRFDPAVNFVSADSTRQLSPIPMNSTNPLFEVLSEDGVSVNEEPPFGASYGSTSSFLKESFGRHQLRPVVAKPSTGSVGSPMGNGKRQVRFPPVQGRGTPPTPVDSPANTPATSSIPATPSSPIPPPETPPSSPLGRSGNGRMFPGPRTGAGSPTLRVLRPAASASPGVAVQPPSPGRATPSSSPAPPASLPRSPLTPTGQSFDGKTVSISPVPEDLKSEAPPPGWEGYVDRKYGITYYHNSATGETVWAVDQGWAELAPQSPNSIASSPTAASPRKATSHGMPSPPTPCLIVKPGASFGEPRTTSPLLGEPAVSAVGPRARMGEAGSESPSSRNCALTSLEDLDDDASDGWKTGVDPATGSLFKYNVHTGVRRAWVMPTLAA